MIDGTPAERLHALGDAVGLTRPQQHMDLMGHEDRGVHGAALCRRRLLETRQGKAVIVYLEAEQLPIMPLLEDRLRDV